MYRISIRRTPVVRCALAATLLALHVASHAAAPKYSVAVVGPLAPTQSFVAGGINAHGQVAGTLSDTGVLPIAATWTPGQPVHRLGRLDGFGAQSRAEAINDAGMVVGSSGPQGRSHAFTWTRQGGMTDLGALLPQALATAGLSVNNAGQVVIAEYLLSHSTLGGAHAYVWTAELGIAPIEPTFAGASVFAKAGNQLGQVTGYSGTATGWEAFIWTRADGMRTLGRPLGWYDGTEGDAINDEGLIVGNSTVGCCINAVQWSPDGGWSALGYVPNFLGYSAAFAVNDAGVIVGGSAKGNDAHDIAAIWFPGHVVADLSIFIDPADPLAGVVKLTSAVGINDRGQILANCTLDGRAQAVVLTPEE